MSMFPGIGKSLRSISPDATLQSTLMPQGLRDQPIFSAMIVDSIAYANAYLVQTDLCGAVLASASTPGSSFTATGYRDHGMYVPGQRVVCYLPPLALQPTILGPLNAEVSDEFNLPDILQQGSSTTFLDEVVHRFLISNNKTGYIRSFNANRPLDSFPGEKGWMNSLGMGINLSLTSAFMRASEICGLWMFYQNDLMRQAAYNYEFWTACQEVYSGNDETEGNTIRRSNPFVWEMAGAPTYGSEVHRESTKGWEAGNTDAVYEPKVVDQMGIFRFHDFEGYLGDIKREIVSCPPASLTAVETYSKTTKHIGLSEFTRHANGHISIRSAKGISLSKELIIPVPKQLCVPDNPAGDQIDQNNYKFAGTVGTGDDHTKTDFTSTDEAPAARFAQLDDYHAWLYNSYAAAGFTYHKKDWYLPQESMLLENYGNKGSVDTAAMQPLGLKYAASLPDSLTIKIDQRTGHSHRYYRSKASVDLLDDGGISITDGWGTELRMSGGNFELTGQGDGFIRTGRNIYLWAPRDLIGRAGNCVDLTASLGDVRVKSQRNMHFLAGNGDTGGILLESRSKNAVQDFAGKVGTDVNSSGIVLLARDSEVLSYGQSVYIRSVNSGNVVLDADNGDGNILLLAGNRFETVKGQISTAFGVKPDENSQDLTVEVHNENSVVFGQSGTMAIAAGQLLAYQATIWAGSSINALGGLNQVGGDGTVGSIKPPAPDQMKGKAKKFVDDNVENTKTYRNFVRLTYFNSKDGRGDDDFIKRIGFSLRSDEQYAITDFVVYEARWQQAFRVLGKDTKWNEPIISSPDGKETAPFPGYAGLTSENSFKTVDAKFWDLQKGYNADRRYEDPTANDTTTDTFENGYLINVQQ